MQIMLFLSPILHVHGRHDQRLRTLPNEFIHHIAIAQIIADPNAQSTPRRFPHLALHSRFPIFEELDRDTLGLFEFNLTGRADNKRSVEKLSFRQFITTTANQVSLIPTAPFLHIIRNSGRKCVFAQHDQFRVRFPISQTIQSRQQFRFTRELNLHTRNPDCPRNFPSRPFVRRSQHERTSRGDHHRTPHQHPPSFRQQYPADQCHQEKTDAVHAQPLER